VTDDVIDWPIPNEIIDCYYQVILFIYFDYDKKWFYVRNFKCRSNYELIYKKLSRP